MLSLTGLSINPTWLRQYVQLCRIQTLSVMTSALGIGKSLYPLTHAQEKSQPTSDEHEVRSDSRPSTLPYNFIHLHSKTNFIWSVWEGRSLYWNWRILRRVLRRLYHPAAGNLEIPELDQHSHFEKSLSSTRGFHGSEQRLTLLSLCSSLHPHFLTALRSPLLGLKVHSSRFLMGHNFHLLWSLCQYSWF